MRFVNTLPAALAATLFVAMPVSAPAQQSASSNDTAESDRDRDEVVCRRAAAPTGSRIGARRVCQRQSQWDAAEREAREAVERASVNRNSE